MLALRLDSDVEKRLEALSKKTGRTKTSYAKAAILEHLEDMEDVHLCGFAEDQKGALNLLESQQVDLAIVDIELKEGSGIGVLQALKSDPSRYGPPVTVILSNHAHPAMRERCAKLGIDAFFDKSLQMSQFINYMHQVIKQRRNGH